MRRRRLLRGVLLVGGAILIAIPVAAIGCSRLAPKPEPVVEKFGPGDPVPKVSTRGSGPRATRWVEIGDPAAPGILFVHGSPGGWDAFLPWLRDEELASRAHLMAPDRPGFGGSGRGVAVPSLSRQAAPLAERLADRADRSPVLVVGHSLGGAVAARLAADAPELVDALLLVAPSVDPALEKLRWYNRLAGWPPVEAVLPADLVTSNREILPLRAELEELASEWSRIEARVTVVQGLEDRLVPAGNADFVERSLPPGRTRILRIPDAGHFLLWQRPELVRAELMRWLDGRKDPVGTDSTTRGEGS